MVHYHIRPQLDDEQGYQQTVASQIYLWHFYIKPKQLHQPIKFNFSSKYKSQHIV